MINKDGGDTAVMRGDIELMGDPPVPPLGKTLGKTLKLLSMVLKLKQEGMTKEWLDSLLVLFKV